MNLNKVVREPSRRIYSALSKKLENEVSLRQGEVENKKLPRIEFFCNNNHTQAFNRLETLATSIRVNRV